MNFSFGKKLQHQMFIVTNYFIINENNINNNMQNISKILQSVILYVIFIIIYVHYMVHLVFPILPKFSVTLILLLAVQVKIFFKEKIRNLFFYPFYWILSFLFEFLYTIEFQHAVVILF